MGTPGVGSLLIVVGSARSRVDFALSLILITLLELDFSIECKAASGHSESCKPTLLVCHTLRIFVTSTNRVKKTGWIHIYRDIMNLAIFCGSGSRRVR
jgi:hypothetical protein